MAATKTPPKPSVTGGPVAAAARRAKGPALTAGATVAGLAGGLALGARLGSKRRKVLGLPIGSRNGLVRTAEALGQAAQRLSEATNQVSATSNDVRQIREELDKANRRSPLEIVLDGLTHRRGAHKRES
jgi:hypothetical protein